MASTKQQSRLFASMLPTQTTMRIPKPRTKPVLLLEGDTFVVNHDGICRTFYKLHGSSYGMEEFYDIGKARKTFVTRMHIRNVHPKEQTPAGAQKGGVVRLGSPLHSLQVQEIDRGIFGAAGTGAMTWEASIAMALYFKAQPQLLIGNILELGSGVGVGGMLLSRVSFSPMKSLTLTDNNHEVLDQCRKNINKLPIGLASGVTPIHVQKLDWYDSVSDHAKYDTILASDVAYQYPDVLALTCCMARMLRQDTHARIHMFGPSTRGALHDAIQQLQNVHGFKVQLEDIEMHRHRLYCSQDLADATLEEECTYASKGLARFLHVTASHPGQSEKVQSANASISEID